MASVGRTWIETLPTSSRLQAFVELAAGEPVARPARQRRGVDADRHRERRLVHGEQGQRLGLVEAAIVSPIVTSGIPATTTISPDPGGVDLRALEPLGDVELGDAGALDASVAPAPRDFGGAPDGPAVHAADGEPAVVGGGVEVRHQRLQGRVRVAAGRRDPLGEGGRRAGARWSPRSSGSSDAHPSRAEA